MNKYESLISWLQGELYRVIRKHGNSDFGKKQSKKLEHEIEYFQQCT